MALGIGAPGRVARNQEELQKILRESSNVARHHVGELLVDDGVLAQETLDQVLREQAQAPHRKLGEILIERGLATDEQVHRAVARRLDIPFVRLADFSIEPKALELLDSEFARNHAVVPLMVDGNNLVVAIEDASNSELVDLLQFLTNRQIVVVTATSADIDYAISTAYNPLGDDPLMHEVERLTRALNETRGSKADPAESRPLVRLVQNIIVDAIRRNASDIHIRPREKDAQVIFRINGSLIPIRTIRKATLPSIVSRIKILGRMDISEHRIPQDGQARMTNRGRVIDLRLSVMPAVHGESVVIRILDASHGLKSLDEIGFNDDDERRFRDLLHRNQGLILVTGPTGSGKSTTLYAALQEVRRQEVNVVTVEDPVEYHLDGIDQIQVAPNIGYTFPRALRHILRHDPDAIMVGEIRDVETAKMAVESALTGHLVLTTLHTESAAKSVTRLLEIGIDAYLVRTVLSGVLAQRLVRLNCPHCNQREEVDAAARRDLGVGADEVFYRSTGCDYCWHTGYKGRHAVYELLMVTPALRDRIVAGVDAGELTEQAVADGMVSLTANALQLARRGHIPISEVLRVRLI